MGDVFFVRGFEGGGKLVAEAQDLVEG